MASSSTSSSSSLTAAAADSQHSLAMLLSELSSIVRTLGTAASPLLYEPISPGLLICSDSNHKSDIISIIDAFNRLL